MRRLLFLLICLPVAAFAGCGDGGGDPTVQAPPEPPEQQFAAGVKSEVYELNTALKEEGAEGVDVDGLVESLEEYEDEAVGEHEATYKSLLEGAQALQKLVNDSGSAADIQKKIDELIALADKLPGDVSAEGGESGDDDE